MKKTIIIGLLAGTAALGPAQTLTGRFSDLNYNYVYGAGGDTHVGGDQVTDGALLATDAEHLDFFGETSGVLPGNLPYAGAVSLENDLTYTITGPLHAFESISAAGEMEGWASASGVGGAVMNSSNPGNQLIFNFDVTGTLDYSFDGAIAGQEVGAGHLIAIQKFDGLVWQTVWSSWSLPGLQGSFDIDGTLTTGQHRIFSQIGLKADAGENWSTSFNYNFNAVPEPITALGLLPAIWVMRRRRR